MSDVTPNVTREEVRKWVAGCLVVNDMRVKVGSDDVGPYLRHILAALDDAERYRWIELQVSLGHIVAISPTIDVDDEEGVALKVGGRREVYDWTLDVCIDAARAGDTP